MFVSLHDHSILFT